MVVEAVKEARSALEFVSGGASRGFGEWCLRQCSRAGTLPGFASKALREDRGVALAAVHLDDAALELS